MSTAEPIRVIVTGGGTGGHLFPGIAAASEMRQQFAECKILFIGTNRHVDRENLIDTGFEVATIHCLGLKGMGIMGKLRGLAQLPLAIIEAARIIHRFRPHLVLGVGGYVTGPVLAAAKLMGISTCVHEQNSVPGLANKMAGRIVDRIILSLPLAHPFSPQKSVLIGNPVRREILAAAAAHTQKKKKPVTTILILGGSQGAHRVNTLMLEAATLLQKKFGETVRFIHQTGKTDRDLVARGYAQHSINADSADFFKDMAALYQQADLVVSRAGATTLAELSVMGLPTLLIPYPFAADNHQEINGRYYVEGGGARMFTEKFLTGEKLAEEIADIISDPQKLNTMAADMRKLGKPEAARQIVQQCRQLIKK